MNCLINNFFSVINNLWSNDIFVLVKVILNRTIMKSGKNLYIYLQFYLYNKSISLHHKFQVLRISRHKTFHLSFNIYDKNVIAEETYRIFLALQILILTRK